MIFRTGSTKIVSIVNFNFHVNAPSTLHRKGTAKSPWKGNTFLKKESLWRNKIALSIVLFLILSLINIIIIAAAAAAFRQAWSVSGPNVGEAAPCPDLIRCLKAMAWIPPLLADWRHSFVNNTKHVAERASFYLSIYLLFAPKAISCDFLQLGCGF